MFYSPLSIKFADVSSKCFHKPQEFKVGNYFLLFKANIAKLSDTNGQMAGTWIHRGDHGFDLRERKGTVCYRLLLFSLEWFEEHYEETTWMPIKHRISSDQAFIKFDRSLNCLSTETRDCRKDVCV